MIKILKRTERDLKKEIMQEAESKCIIRSATLELLDFCNFSCKYCYVKDSYHHMISVDNAYQVLKQLREEGCIWLLITGGEPLLHPNFSDIYLFAYNLGFKVSVFTNGYLISKDICELFEKYPPEIVEISLYGYNDLTYDHFVGVKGAFQVFNKKIDLIRQYKIKLLLKFTLTTLNINYFSELKNYCANKKMEYRYDDMVIPRLDQHNEECLNLRLCPEVAHRSMLEDQRYLKNLATKTLTDNISYGSNLLYQCGAGKNSVVIDASLRMSPCILERRISYNLLENGMQIKAGQRYLLNKMSGNLDESDPCFNCIHKPFCRYCPARFALETNDERVPSNWYCEYGKIVYETINRLQTNNGE